MHVVINVPDELYNAISTDTYGVHRGRIYDIIRNGTALPKGHSRLIYEDDIDKYVVGSVDTRYCPTIIGADKESEEK